MLCNLVCLFVVLDFALLGWVARPLALLAAFWVGVGMLIWFGGLLFGFSLRLVCFLSEFLVLGWVLVAVSLLVPFARFASVRWLLLKFAVGLCLEVVAGRVVACW